MKTLIVNADDLGRSAGINRGIFEAHQKGIVTSTTVMINYPDAVPALETALADWPTLGLGLHLNLTSGYPVLPASSIPTLVKPDGLFFTPPEWAEQFLQVAPDDIRRELTAQVEKFIAVTGKPPDHLDSHHHITYLHPAALQTALGFAAKYGLPVRQGGFDRPPAEIRQSFMNLIPSLSEAQAGFMVEQLQVALANGPEPYWPARLEASFHGARATLGDLLIILTTLPPDSLTELMCHPGYVDASLTSPYAQRREEELRHLTHRSTHECVQSEGIQLINFGALRRTERDGE